MEKRSVFAPGYPMSELEAAFWEFHRDNPRVYQLFCQFTQMLIERGRTNHSADAVVHRIRWSASVETNDAEYKINDHHVAYFARLWMLEHPQHAGFFRVRDLRVQREAA